MCLTLSQILSPVEKVREERLLAVSMLVESSSLATVKQQHAGIVDRMLAWSSCWGSLFLGLTVSQLRSSRFVEAPHGLAR